jgi:DNA repair protein RadC
LFLETDYLYKKINAMETIDSGTYAGKMPIPRWAEDDRPREKLINKGKSALSDAELLAILIRSGTRSESAVELARKVLDQASGSLVELSRMGCSDLMRFKGLGEAKALSIIAALELGRRRREAEVQEKQRIGSSRDVFEYFQPVLADLKYEEFWVLLLNRGNRIIRKISISEGGISGTVADPRRIFIAALEHTASSIILCHNHPSGNVQPSEADIRLTKKIKDAGALLEIQVLDHVIIGEENFYSFADEAIL